MTTPNQYQENLFFHYILNEINLLNETKPEYFSNKLVSILFGIAKEHALKYKSAPSKDQLIEVINLKGLSEELNKDVIEALYNSKAAMDQYDNDWLLQTSTSWIRLKNLEITMRKAIAYMKTSPANTENAASIVESVRTMISTETAINLGFEMGLDFFNANSHQQARLSRRSTGYPYIDTCLKGGWWDGALIVFQAMPKAGKSAWLCNLAAKSVEIGHHTAYITLELQGEMVAMRIGSNLLNIPSDKYEEVAKDTVYMKKKLLELKNSSITPMGNLHIKEFPASTASVNDIQNYLVKVQEQLGIKFKNVFIDYINIMKNWRNPNSENTYMKIKQLAEDLRAMGSINEWCVISVTQINRNNMNSSDMSVLDTSESIGLLMTVDALFGIITTPEMKSQGEYMLKCLADRVAPYDNTKKRFTINWNHMRISEDMSVQIEDMDDAVNVHKNSAPRQSSSVTSNFIKTTNITVEKLDNNSLWADTDLLSDLPT